MQYKPGVMKKARICFQPPQAVDDQVFEEKKRSRQVAGLSEVRYTVVCGYPKFTSFIQLLLVDPGSASKA